MTSYTPPAHLSPHQQALCVTLQSFSRFCEKHQIKYFACGGTAIGAVRHKGFIPWDDDIDVYMLREDYDRFLSLKAELAHTDYEIVDPSDSSYYLPFAKYSHKHSTLWERKEEAFIFGVYIDVFPLDYCDGYNPLLISEGNNIKLLWDKYKRGMRRLTKERARRALRGSLVDLKTIFADYFRYRLNKDNFKAKIDEMIDIIKSPTRQEGAYCYCYGIEAVRPHEVFRRAWFSDVVEMPFENLTIYMPIGYHEYMTSQYGDYMQLPPIEQQVSHHPFYYTNLERRLSIEEVRKELGEV